MVKLTKDQINDVARLKHVFANNLDIAEDYYNQLIDGNPEPKVKESRLTELWQSENKTDKRDYLADYFLEKDKLFAKTILDTDELDLYTKIYRDR